MLRVTLKGVRGHLVRYLLTALSVVLGIAFFSGTFILTDSIQKTFDDLVNTASENTDAVVRGQEAGTNPNDFTGAMRAQLPLASAEELSRVEGVEHVSPDIQGTIILVGKDGLPVRNGSAPTLGIAYDPLGGAGKIVSGRPPANEHEVLVEGKTLEKSGLAVGDETKALVGSDPVDVMIVGEYTMNASPAGATLVFVDEATAERVFAPEGTVSSFSVIAKDGVSQEQLVKNLQAALPDTVEVISGEAFARQTRDAIKQGLGFINTFLLVFALIALFVGGFIIFNTFSMLVGQRTRELALLRAVGASRAQVQRVVLGESFVVGLVGGILGLLLGIGLAVGLKAVFAAVGLEITGSLPIAPRTVLFSLALAVGVTMVAAVIPAFRAARIPPMAALRDDYVPKVSSLRVRGSIGVGMTVVGVVVVIAALLPEDVKWLWLGLGAALVVVGTLVAAPLLTRPVVRVVAFPFVWAGGIVGRLARENALRNPRRTATTASALMIGLALISAFTVVAASTKASVSDLVESEFIGDYVVSGGQNPFGDSVGQAIADIPNVASVAQIGALGLDVEGDTIAAVATTSQGLDDNVKVTMVDGSVAALDSGKLLVNRSTAKDKGWQVGDRIVATLGTLVDQSYTVGAIFEDNHVLGAGVVVPRQTYEKAVPTAQRADYAVFVKVADGVDPESVRPQLVDTVKPFLVLSVEDADEFVSSQAAQINQLLYLLYGLLALSVIIAFFGIVNTLALSVFERTREIGLLRAVGFTKSRLRLMIGIESIATAVFGAVLGCVVGLGLGIALQRGLVSEGLEVLSVPYVSLVVFVVLAGVAGLIAAVFPAWRAAKLDVLKAIATE